MNIFKNFLKDKKIGTTKFNLSNRNLSSYRFGELGLLGSYSVLPKDKFSVGTDILTKVEPMPAPAFTNIKQNVYATFTPNQCVWKHWNDYITNATQYSDTYLKNSLLDSVKNQYEIPSIMCTDLQPILKIAHGWAIPVFKISESQINSLLKYFLFIQKSVKADKAEIVNDYFVKVLNARAASSNKDITAFWAFVFQTFKSNKFLPDFFEDIPYFTARIGGSIVGSDISNLAKTSSLEIGCSPVTAYQFYRWIEEVNLTLSQHNFPSVQSSDIISVNDPSSMSNALVAVRWFNDVVNSDVDINHAPFVLVKKSFCDVSTGYKFNYFAYQRNKYKDDSKLSTGKQWSTDHFLTNKSYFRDCGYFWQSLYVEYYYQGDNAASAWRQPVLLNTFPFNNSVYNNVEYCFAEISDYCGFQRDIFISGNDFSLCLSLSKNHELENYTYLKGRSGNLDNYLPGRYSAVDLSLSSLWFVENVQNPIGGNLNSDGISINSVLGSVNIATDTIFPILNTINSGGIGYILPTNLSSYITEESINVGFDAWSFCVYLCQSSARLLDFFNIPTEGLTVRSFLDYCCEYVKALPFFAYSKTWNDIFRNKMVSSPELDFSETNGFLRHDVAMREFLDNVKSNISDMYYSTNQHFQDFVENDVLNSWAIPFSVEPKNSLKDDIITFGSDSVKVADLAHFHDFNVRGFHETFALLTGFNLQAFILLSVADVLQDTNQTLYGILADKLILPSYYNGLLHLKYQNFNKDYFSSGLLDPAAGSTDVDLGTTVRSAVNAEAKQHFWDRLAQNRSISQFWQSVFDTKLSHVEQTKPLMLGSSHSSVQVGEVVQLSQTSDTPQGTRSGLGSNQDKKGLFSKTFNEHGYILILCSHTLDSQYFQGLAKDWRTEDSFLDYPFIDFVGLGNQNINQRELNFEAIPQALPAAGIVQRSNVVNQFTNNVEPPKFNYTFAQVPRLLRRSFNRLDSNLLESDQKLNSTFAFIPRYSTLKFKFDELHGQFRNIYKFWHSFRQFFNQPILSHEFVNWEFLANDNELNRMFFNITDDYDKFLLSANINVIAERPLPYVCTPKTSL